MKKNEFFLKKVKKNLVEQNNGYIFAHRKGYVMREIRRGGILMKCGS